MQRGSLLGFAKVKFPLPARPWIRDGAVVVNEVTGKINYEPVIQFHDHGCRRRWSDAVLKALRTARPDAVPENAP